MFAKVREVYQVYLNPDWLRPIAEEAVENASKAASCEAEMQALQSKITVLTTNPDQMYMERLNGLLSEEDFQRIYQIVKMDRTVLDSAPTRWELLVSLIKQVELTVEVMTPGLARGLV